MKRKCEKCGKAIPSARLDILPDTQTCVGCSEVKAKVVYPVYSHKTAPEIIVVDGDNDEGLRLADRANQRAR
jgi:hypothetical protein